MDSLLSFQFQVLHAITQVICFSNVEKLIIKFSDSCPTQVGACGWRLGCINVKKWRSSALLEQEQKIPDGIFDEMNEPESVPDNVSETNHGEGLHIQTPSYLVYAPAGHLPHVTLEVMKQHIRFKVC